jgi:hypothetical protein
MPTPNFTPEKSAERTAREERLAKALRDNLRRRKDRARAQEERKPSQSKQNRARQDQRDDGEPAA